MYPSPRPKAPGRGSHGHPALLRTPQASQALALPLPKHATYELARRRAPAVRANCVGVNVYGGGARFSSPLGVYDFQKRSSMIHMSGKGAAHLATMTDLLATSEGLEAHALAARVRGQSEIPLV